jgi:hypothetical protein
MLPIYEAIDILEVIPAEVGHTKPWVVVANTPQGLKKFIVKLYTVPQAENHCVCNEVIGNVLSGQFGLQAPPAAFIHIPDELDMALKPENQEQYYNADTRLKFATEEVQNKSYITGLSRTQINKRISMDTLYAFDNLIRNADRGQQKTNLLITNRAAYLIDHELILKPNEICGIDLENFNIEDKFSRYHIFYRLLKKSRKVNKINFFDEFSEYLRVVNFNCLASYFQQLRNEGFTVNENEILNWFNQIKQNQVTFVNKLRISIP